MKNNIVKALALLLSVNCCFPGMLVNAEEPEEKTKTVTNLLPGANLDSIGNESEILSESLKNTELPQFDSNAIPSLLEYQNNDGEEKDGEGENLTDVNDEEKKKESARLEDTGLKQLQIPQHLEVVIDPWEMDGKGQIYSEQYIIRNDGEEPGILTLSHLACKVSGESEAVVTTNRAGLHDGDEKLICMQMIFGNGDQIELSEDGSTYQVELQPGEELSVCFKGEVNEYASESWKDGDVAVEVVYSWNVVQMPDDIEEKEKVSEDFKMENGAEETEEVKEDEKKSQDIDLDANGGEINENKEEQIVEEMQEGEEALKNEEVTESEEPIQSKEEVANTEVIELKEFKPIEFVIDKWESDGEGHLCSGWYLVRTEGETEGVFVLSDLLYMDEEQNEIDVLREKEEVNDSESEPFHMELMLENGERIDIIRKVLEKNPEEKGYRVILRPGEELKIQFIGERDDVASKEIQKGNIIVKASGSWEREEEGKVE